MTIIIRYWQNKAYICNIITPTYIIIIAYGSKRIASGKGRGRYDSGPDKGKTGYYSQGS